MLLGPGPVNSRTRARPALGEHLRGPQYVLGEPIPRETSPSAFGFASPGPESCERSTPQ